MKSCASFATAAIEEPATKDLDIRQRPVATVAETTDDGKRLAGHVTADIPFGRPLFIELL